MTTLLSAFFLLVGSTICLIAALGVLRLPDFFLRMHAATKAGVAGAGLVLVGVAFAEPSVGMWVKVALAIAFLLLTTPIAGHLLARAGYVAGVPLWGGTYQDELQRELPRGEFERRDNRAGPSTATESDPNYARSVVLALTSGPSGAVAIDRAIAMAQAGDRPLIALAIVDTKMLSHVGPVPLGGNHYAAQLRRSQIEKARRALADTVQQFEEKARSAGVAYSIAMDEGDPVKIIRSHIAGAFSIIVGREGWFDHGLAGGRPRPLEHLVRHGIHPLFGVSARTATIRSVMFVHDGTPRSDRTLDWFLERDPWPDAAVHLVPDAATRQAEIAAAWQRAAAVLRERLAEPGDGGIDLASCEALVFGNEGHPGWINAMRASSRPRSNDIPIVVFG